MPCCIHSNGHLSFEAHLTKEGMRQAEHRRVDRAVKLPASFVRYLYRTECLNRSVPTLTVGLNGAR